MSALQLFRFQRYAAEMGDISRTADMMSSPSRSCLFYNETPEYAAIDVPDEEYQFAIMDLVKASNVCLFEGKLIDRVTPQKVSFVGNFASYTERRSDSFWRVERQWRYWGEVMSSDQEDAEVTLKPLIPVVILAGVGGLGFAYLRKTKNVVGWAQAKQCFRWIFQKWVD